MTLETLSRFLLWSMAFNYAVLFIWFFAFIFARGWLRGLHGRWFKMPGSAFDAIHYGGMAIYKIGILLFNLAPFVALWIVRRGG